MSTSNQAQPLPIAWPVIAKLENGQRLHGHVCRVTTSPYAPTRYRVTSQFEPYRYVDVADSQVTTRRADDRYPFTPEAAARA